MQHITVELDLPRPVQIPDDYNLREAVLTFLYKQGIVSGDDIAETIGIPRHTLRDHLRKYGFEDIPNAGTIRAFAEVENPATITRYPDVKTAMADAWDRD